MIQTEHNTNSKISAWLGELISNLHTDQWLVEGNLLSPETQSFYLKMATSNHEELALHMKESTKKMFFTKIILEYLNRLGSKIESLEKLALDLSDAKVLVWAEIHDNDEAMEDALYLAEAYVNALYAAKGFSLRSTIVENRDHLSVPSHYKSFYNSK